MHFFSGLVAALPALAAAQDVPQYQAQFQNILGQIGSYIPNPSQHDPVAAMEAKTGALKLHTLTLDNWRDTFYEPVKPGAKKAEEWWVLFSGGNKTCFGRCGNIEKAFNETAGKFAVLPSSPHMAYVNCDDQPILCNAWSATTGSLWVVEMLPPPAAIDIYRTRLNFTSTTSDDLVAFSKVDKKDSPRFALLDSWFHPFNGQAADMGLSVPFGYAVWVFGLIPNWLFMLTISFASRSFMGNRMAPPQGGAAGARPGGAQPAQAAR